MTTQQIQRFGIIDGGLMLSDCGELITYADHLAAIAAARREWEAGKQLKAEAEAQWLGARAKFDASQLERVKAILHDINAQGYVLVTETGHDVSVETATEVLTEAIITAAFTEGSGA